ncbi:LicD family protein [Butyrivibrio sp. MC2013]|uniref:LicD family protein n=1 Tax=Butyrivibrio sp. MC2013 TaxID=1280686 RepID=UPI0003FC7353|nr:LicD family protein [Butyrivibrio sp. MC2013]
MEAINKEAYLPKLHNEILEIMDEIHNLCKDNGLRYYLCAGSLLGAIRHNGFIPWDDDLDIMMPREDFNRFINICSDKLGDRFSLAWITTEKKYSRGFAKVCKKGTLFQEDNGRTVSKWGIFVDIFPIDLTDGSIDEIAQTKERYRRVLGIIEQKDITDRLPFPKNVIISLIPRKLLFAMLDWISVGKSKTGRYYTRFASQYPGERVTYPVETFGEGVLHSFEDRNYIIPTDYDYHLKTTYGSKYMELPPEEKRRCHYPRKVIFSDGLIMEFEAPKKRVTANETI